MAHNPNVNYIYPPNYYIEEPENYVADYSENEIISENQQILQAGPHTNITEIYTRKAAAMALQTQMIPNETRFRPKHYLQPCYCENAHQLPGTHIAVPIKNYSQTFDPTVYHQNCSVSTASQIDNFDCNAYKSRSAHLGMAVPHCPNHPINYQNNASEIQKQQTIKKYPVKVGTPKYYRKPPANAIFKRPSALCLPVASQLDPASTHRRPKKSTVVEPQYCYPQEISYTDETASRPLLLNKEQIQPNLIAHKMNSEGDINKKLSSLDEILSQFEKRTERLKPKSRCDLAKFARFLKPRVPLSIKEKHQRSKFKLNQESEMVEGQFPDANGNDKDCTGLDMQEVTEDSLEKLLNQLKKCELEESFDKNEAKEDIRANLCNERRNENDSHKDETEQIDVADEEYSKQEITQKIGPKSFNYQDITNQMLRSQSESKCFEGSSNTTAQSSIQDITKRVSSSSSATTSQKPRAYNMVKPLDDHCALELHRSKSYIVNLIDRALSKELGTIPSERCQKEFSNMNPRRAIDMVNRHTSLGKTDDLCLEITSALTESIISNATAPGSRPTTGSHSRNKLCCCHEEPTYIKQLKQLRWGHLKHIQREVRRLEDLERFLDSCSLNTISEF